MMSQNRPSLESLGVLVAILVGACSSEDPVDPIYVEPGSTTAASGVGGASTGVGTTGTLGSTVNGVTIGTATSSVGGATASVTSVTSVTSATSGTTGGGASTTTTATTGFPATNTTGSPTTGGFTTGSTAATTGGGGSSSAQCNTISGREFFQRPTECAYCHGQDALGVPGQGPEVRHPPEDYARWLVRNGRMDHPDYPDGMAPYDTCVVTNVMLDDIIAFLNEFPVPTDGQGLYEDFCANCHGVDGRGGVTARDLNGEVHAVSMITSTGHNPADYANRREFMPVMTQQLSSAQIDLISQYLQNNLGLAF